MQIMTQLAFQTQAEADGKWRRLQLSHDQLSTYFAGLEAIESARSDTNFTVQDFNRRVLRMGAVEPRFIEPLLKNEPPGTAQPK
jgi:hypothetical protein